MLRTTASVRRGLGRLWLQKKKRKILRKPAAASVSPVKKTFTKEDTLSSNSEKSMAK